VQFASVVHEGSPRAVAVRSGKAIPLRGVAELGAQTPSSFLRDPPLNEAGSVPLDAVRFRPTVPRPGKIVCVGLNYLAHVEESRRDLPEYPVLFTKFAASLAGPYDPIPCPPESSAADYEGELAVVIGAPARRIGQDEALGAIAGYTVANDVTMRDFQNKTHQWLQGKAWDASTPLGPYLVTTDELDDPGNLTLRTTLNGETVQAASTRQLIFSIPKLISVISTFTTLEPGDLILTGTPSGVGFRREPPRLLAPGDVVAVEIECVGRIENTVIDEVGR
jgi:acylpyruvate hydrolase